MISNVVQTLPLEHRKQLASQMHPYPLLEVVTGTHLTGQETDRQRQITLQAEIQAGIKCGEDVYKTTVPYQLALSLAQRYQQTLRQWNRQLTVPYGKGLLRRLRLADNSKKFRLVLEQLQQLCKDSTNPNIVGVAMRRLLEKILDRRF